jgi:hypothetical protein
MRILDARMYRAPFETRRLLEEAGYVYDGTSWVRREHPPGVVQSRTLDGEIAAHMTTDQVVAWIRAGETEKP